MNCLWMLGWMGILFAILMIITFGFAYDSVQSNTICLAWQKAFGIEPATMGIVLTAFTLLIIFGGIQRVAKFSSTVVPVMAVVYLLIALGVVVCNITYLPEVLLTIVENAFGFNQAVMIWLFAFSSIIGNYYYGETNVRYIKDTKLGVFVYCLAVAAKVMTGAVVSLDFAWSIADITMALLTLCNLVAIVLLSRQAVFLLQDYRQQKRECKNPVFSKDKMPDHTYK